MEKKYYSPLPQLRNNNFVNLNQKPGTSILVKTNVKQRSKDKVSDFTTNLPKKIVSGDVNYIYPSKKEFYDHTELNLFKNLVFLYSITIHKLLKFEYNIMKKFTNLEIYFGILYTSYKKINMLFDLKFEIQEKGIFNVSDKYEIPSTDLLLICDEICKLIRENCIFSRFQHLFILELSKFQI